MHRYALLLLVLTTTACITAAQQNAAGPPSQQRILAAQRRISVDPKAWQAYNELASALLRAARDSSDAALYERADNALQHSLQLSPANYDARKLRISLLLAEHDYSEGMKLAAELNKKVPDDIAVWGFLVDANVALGNYPEAERAAQWILDLRSGSTLGFVKAAELRELFGDFEGAIEFFDEANRRTSQNDTEERSWLLTQNARLQLLSGSIKRASELLDQALKLYSNSQLAFAVLAKLRSYERNYSEAVSLLERRYRAMPNLSNLYDLAEALDRGGRHEEANLAFQQFETKARSQIANPYNFNGQLVLFYTDRKNEPLEALAIAIREVERRHDVNTLDAYPWALYRNGKLAEAKSQMERVLAVGVRNPLYFCHAARIASKLSDVASAKRFEEQSAALEPGLCAAEPQPQPAEMKLR
jgi:tetratricopeptide (TPR) repeat protein